MPHSRTPFQTRKAAGVLRVEFGARFLQDDTGASWDELTTLIDAPSPERVVLDFSDTLEYDSSAIVLAAMVQAKCEHCSVPCEVRTPTAGFRELLDAAATRSTAVSRDSARPEGDRRPLARLGGTALWALDRLYSGLVFTGETASGLGEVVRRPGRTRWGEVIRILQHAGADALPIVALICFLMGVIMAFQAAVQLHSFGADIYVADLVALSVVRELGPLMTAIICAGRSGAGFAAELGAMKVGEEVDALVTMGLGVQRFLVTPKILALLIALPCLTVLGNVIAILGGMLISATVLGLPATVYWNETILTLTYSDFFGGLAKSLVFAALIAGIGCYRGLEVGTDAQDVGRKTTSAVVTGVFFIILTDAGFSVLYHVLGI